MNKLQRKPLHCLRRSYARADLALCSLLLGVRYEYVMCRPRPAYVNGTRLSSVCKVNGTVFRVMAALTLDLDLQSVPDNKHI